MILSDIVNNPMSMRQMSRIELQITLLGGEFCRGDFALRLLLLSAIAIAIHHSCCFVFSKFVVDFAYSSKCQCLNKSKV